MRSAGATMYRPLGASGLSVSALGVGCGTLAMIGEDRGALEAAWESGLRYFDTAPLYRGSERRLGAALQGQNRGTYVLSSKVGRFPAQEGERRFDFSRDALLKSFEETLKQLRTGYIDLLALHDLTPTMLRSGYAAARMNMHNGGLEALFALKAQGSVRALGLALYDVDAALEWLEIAPFDYVMIAGGFTLLSLAALPRLLPLCAARGVGVLIASPFHSGLLATGAISGARFNHRGADPDVLANVRRIESVCERFEVPLAAAALQFPLRWASVASVVASHSTPAEIRANIALIDSPIPEAFWAALVEEGLTVPDAVFPLSCGDL